MTPVLIFPPFASPTYIPLGVSLIKAYADRELGPGAVRLIDLNTRFWNSIAESREPYSDFRSFVKGKKGGFSPLYYAPYIPIRQEMGREAKSFLNKIALYLDMGELPESLESFFYDLASSVDSGGSFIGFSCLFPDQLLFTLGFTCWLKQQGCALPLYIGGASAALCRPGDILARASWIDGVIAGEGELAFLALLKKSPRDQIPGLCWRDRTGIRQNSKPGTISFHHLPDPDFSWIDFTSYFNPEPVLPLLLSRGCKWRRCRFCAHNFSFSGYRTMTAERIAGTLQFYLSQYGIRHFYFADQYLDAGLLDQVAGEIIKRNLPVYYTFMGRPAENMTKEVLDKLYISGCRWISWGVETGSQKLLDLAGKGTTVERIGRVLKESAEAGIKNLAMMIFGLPGSDDQALEETFSFLEENAPYIQTLTTSEFLLYNDTPFGKNPRAYALEKGEPFLFCRIMGQPLHTTQRGYKVMERDIPRMPRGPEESDLWLKRKPWLYPPSVFDHLPSEHYLILSARASRSGTPEGPSPLRDIS